MDIDGYVALALRSGFPAPLLRLGSVVRDAWLDAYLDHVVFRDVRAAGQVRDPVRLRRYLEVLGRSTAGLPAEATLYQAVGIDRRTAEAYDRLLESLYLLDWLPAGGSCSTPGRSRSNSATGSGRYRCAPCGRQRLPLETTDRGQPQRWAGRTTSPELMRDEAHYSSSIPAGV